MLLACFNAYYLVNLGVWTKALALPGEVNCVITEPVSGPTTIKPEWAEGYCEGGREGAKLLDYD